MGDDRILQYQKMCAVLEDERRVEAGIVAALRVCADEHQRNANQLLQRIVHLWSVIDKLKAESCA